MRSGIRIHVHDAESHLAERELSEPFLLMCCHQTVGCSVVWTWIGMAHSSGSPMGWWSSGPVASPAWWSLS